jgi:ADP-ribose pyrophosphatase
MKNAGLYRWPTSRLSSLPASRLPSRSEEISMTAKTNNHSTIYEGRVFKLVRENVTLANGTTTDMEFIEHPGAAAVVPILDDSRILLLQQYRHALKKDIWEIPAGTLDPREEIIDCAKRELIEETGFSAGRWQKLGEITPVPGYSDERIHIYLATQLQPAEQHLDADEVIQVQAVEFKDAIDMIGNGEIQDAKSIAGLFLASQWLKSNA